jgi:TAP-like protein
MLVLSGPYDPVTPPRWAEQALPYLPHARHVIVPEAHHGSGGLSHPDCIQQLSTAFVERGTADGLDTSCIATMMPPPFNTDAATFDAIMKAAANLVGNGQVAVRSAHKLLYVNKCLDGTKTSSTI